MSRGVRSCQAAASARNSKLTRGTLPFPPRESGERNKRTQRHQVRREEIQWTYLPLHRPLHAASVQSKSRTESLVEGLGRLFLSSLRSTAAHLPHWGAGGDLGSEQSRCWRTRSRLQTSSRWADVYRRDNSRWPFYPDKSFKIVPR